MNKSRYPNAQLIVKENLVGVVAPTEWEAIGAAQQVAADTQWSDWKGLPASSDTTGGCARRRTEDHAAGQGRQRSNSRSKAYLCIDQ